MDKIKLDELQLAIMKVVWDKGQCSANEVLMELNASSERNLAPTTVATVLQRLDKKGIVGHSKEGRQYIYHPLVGKDYAKTSMVSNLLTQMFEGKSFQLVNHLIQSTEFDQEELAQLKEFVDESLKQNGDGKLDH